MWFKNQNWRRWSQLYFLLLYMTAGFFLYKAVHSLPELGETAFSYRFPALEGFLPISATVGLKYWLFTGQYDPIHPEGISKSGSKGSVCGRGRRKCRKRGIEDC